MKIKTKYLIFLLSITINLGSCATNKIQTAGISVEEQQKNLAKEKKIREKRARKNKRKAEKLYWKRQSKERRKSVQQNLKRQKKRMRKRRR